MSRAVCVHGVDSNGRKVLYEGHAPCRIGDPVQTWATLMDLSGTMALADWDKPTEPATEA